MADNSVVQTIKDAEIDARSLSEFIYKPASFMVTRRLAPPIHTLDYYISTVADITSKVVADSGAFDSVIVAANSKLDNAVSAAESKVGYIESTVQNAINNTAVEGGVLADTFVTVTKKTQKAVARTQADVNREYISVKDYGAVGDGVADDTQAFRNAISDAPLNSTIYMPKGEYRITDSLVWKTNLSLIGDGVGVSVIKMDGEYFSAIDGTVHGFEGSYVYKDCRFEDFEIDGSGLTYDRAGVGGKGMFILFMERAVFRNLYIHHTIGTGLGCDFLVDSVIDSCNVSYCGRNYGKEGSTVGQSGIGIGTGWREVESISITNCTTNYNGNHGVFVEIQDLPDAPTNPLGAKISNCYAEGNLIGFRNKSSGNTMFSNCYAYKNRSHGFLNNLTKQAITLTSNCISEANGGHGFSGTFISSLDTYSNCIALNNKDRGFRFATSSINDDFIGGNGVTLNSCVAYGNTTHGIDILSTLDLGQGNHKISNCSSLNNGLNGFFGQNLKYAQISNSYFDGNLGEGLHITSVAPESDIYVSGVFARNNGLNGLKVNIHNGANMLMVSDGVYSDNGLKDISGSRFGITIGTSSRVVVSRNICSNISSGKQDTGININVGSSMTADVIVEDNDVRGNTFSTIAYPTSTSSKITLKNNKGFNDTGTVNSITFDSSPASISTRPYPIRYYINSSGDSVTIKKGGLPILSNVSNAVVDVPPNDSSYVVEYGSPLTVYTQKY